MRHSARALPLVLALCSAGLAHAGPKLVSYLPTWQSEQDRARAAAVLAELDIGIYSFIEVRPDGTAFIADGALPVAQTWKKAFAAARQRNPALDCHWAIGGWTGSRHLAKVAGNETTRARLADTAVAIMRDYRCQGLDLDWEHPVTGGNYPDDAAAADRDNYIKLLETLRAALDQAGTADGRKYALTAAIPGVAGGWGVSGYDLKRAAKLLDRVNLMSYDYYGAWSPRAGLHAALHPTPGEPDSSVLNGDGGVKHFLAQGFKPAQLVLGVPFYARAQGNVEPGPNGDGLAQPAKGPGLTHYPEPGTVQYALLRKDLIGQPGWKAFRSQAAGDAPYLYNAATKELVSYDDPQSLKVKAQYIKAQQLGGAMIWEFTQDDAAHSLLRALKDNLK
ncbi:glycoside hydrolase family 18 protein [Chitiniphilus purpureus]|uniref:chitinase n=1 Tax=Chitiniphilus purpureus TaxID=2981137 RepID=A0ABY6DRC4_9NEIS|nr:glycoside hydrolase family 18 protein [Chitiniphilus sp. CD1]UXY16909.1 glycoside hydrolase family 18 protein [Chitiniphilus sp. CD1]